MGIVYFAHSCVSFSFLPIILNVTNYHQLSYIPFNIVSGISTAHDPRRPFSLGPNCHSFFWRLSQFDVECDGTWYRLFYFDAD